jgi:hypothetical protein
MIKGKTTLILAMIIALGLAVGQTGRGAGGENIAAVPAQGKDDRNAVKEPVRDDRNDAAVLREEIEELKKRVDELEERAAKQDEKSKLTISGFFDVSMSNYQNRPNVFTLGDFELDLSHTYKQNLQVAAALVFNKGAELGVGFIDYHLFGGSIATRGRLFSERGLHLQVGKFDVPFGNDWQYYTSVNRMEVNAPLTTEMVMEGKYNDVGMRLLANLVSFNGTLYVLRGIEQGYSYGGNSFGGRVGFTPFNNPYTLRSRKVSLFEAGASCIYDIEKSGKTAERLFAGDIEGNVGPVTLRSEYFWRDKLIGIIQRGFHVTVSLDLHWFSPLPLDVYTRYDSFTFDRYMKVDETREQSRLTAGVRVDLFDISFIKLEFIQYLTASEIYRSEEYFSEQLFYAQLIIRF